MMDNNVFVAVVMAASVIMSIVGCVVAILIFLKGDRDRS